MIPWLTSGAGRHLRWAAPLWCLAACSEPSQPVGDTTNDGSSEGSPAVVEPRVKVETPAEPTPEVPRSVPAVEDTGLIADPDVTASSDRCECPEVWTGARVTLVGPTSSGVQGSGSRDSGAIDAGGENAGAEDAGAEDAGAKSSMGWTLEVPVEGGSCDPDRVYGQLRTVCRNVQLWLDVCAGPSGQAPCLHARGDSIQFVATSGATYEGRLPVGPLPSLDDQQNAVAGEVELDVSDGEATFRLSIDFAFCGHITESRIAC